MTSSSQVDIRLATSKTFEYLLDWFPDIIQSVDANGKIVFANRKACELLGYSSDELIGMSIEQLYAPEVLDLVHQGFKSLKRDGALSVRESIIRDKNGNRITVEIRSFAVYDEAGNFLRTFSILRDIRDLKDLQDSLLHTSRLAAIGELSACIAHDVSNPLSVVKLYGELLEAQLHDAATDPTALEGVDESLSNLRKSVDKMERLINHLRDFSRSTHTPAEEFDLREAINDALFMMTNKLDKGDVDVVKRVPNTPCLMHGHSNQLEQVFMNLFSNGCDAMKGRPASQLRVELTTPEFHSDRPQWRVTVADNGCGMTKEVQDMLYTPFFTTKPRGQGTGLGMSIVKNIIRRHGGDLSIQSTPGTGTTFTLLLPQELRPADSAPPPPPA